MPNKAKSLGLTQELEIKYINSLILDLEQSLAELHKSGRIDSSTSLHSIFIGGGTPSLFSGQSIATLLDRISNLITIPNNCEITLEANPGTYESNKFKAFKQAGINRLSIGVQSFNDASLKQLGRVHDSKQAKLALDAAKEADFNFNIDLMHSLPGQNLELALIDLTLAFSFEPNHLSWYQLTIEPNTKFAKHTPVLPSTHTQEDIYTAGLELLANNNYQRYEISAYANNSNNKADLNKSVHNLNYWNFGDYLGIGAGAHSKITTQNGTLNNTNRSWKQKSPIRYLDPNVNKVSGTVTISQSELLLEFMMNKLRVLDPIQEKDLYSHTNYKFEDIKKLINQAIDNKWLTFQKNSLATTDLGLRFLNDLILLFA